MHRRPQVYQLLLLSRVIDIKYGRFAFFYLFINPGDEVAKHASPGIFNTLYFLHICIYKAVYEVLACVDTCKELIHFRVLAPELNVKGRSIQSFKKGRSSHVLQFTNKLTSEELKVTGTRPILTNQRCIIYESKIM